MSSQRSDRVSLRFRPHELEAVDAAARVAHCTRSEIIREASVRLASSLLSATRLERTALLPADLPIPAEPNKELGSSAEQRSALGILERLGQAGEGT